MFESHFGFQHPPFAATPDPRSWFATPRLRELVDELAVRLETGQGICLLTGAAGLGKSLICRVVAQELASPCHVLYLAAPAVLAPRSLFQTLLSELDHSLPGLDLHELRLALLQTLREQVRADRPCVLLVDEAHLLPRRLFEELRALTVLDEQAQPLLRLMLAGQPRLEELLTGAEFDALNQQVATHQLLEPLSLTESVEYILHRVYWAGGDTAGLFSIPALDFIVQACSGIPRLLNRLCDQSLLVTEASQLSQVDLPQVETALDSLRHLPLAWNEEFLRRRGLVDAPRESFAEASSLPATDASPSLDLEDHEPLEWNDRSEHEGLSHDPLATEDDLESPLAEDVVEPDVWPPPREQVAASAPALPEPVGEDAADDDLPADFADEPPAPIAFPWRDAVTSAVGIPPATGDFEPIEEAFDGDSPRVPAPTGVTFDERALAEEWSRRLRRDLPQVPLALPPEPPPNVALEGRVPPAWDPPRHSPADAPKWNAAANASEHSTIGQAPVVNSPTGNSPVRGPARPAPGASTAAVPTASPGLLTPRLAIGSLTERSLDEGDLVYDVVEPEEPPLATPRGRRPRLMNGIAVVAEMISTETLPAEPVAGAGDPVTSSVATGSAATWSAAAGPPATRVHGTPAASTVDSTVARPVADPPAVDEQEPAAAAVQVTHPPHEVPAPRGSTKPGLGRLFTVLRHKLDATRGRAPGR